MRQIAESMRHVYVYIRSNLIHTFVTTRINSPRDDAMW